MGGGAGGNKFSRNNYIFRMKWGRREGESGMDSAVMWQQHDKDEFESRHQIAKASSEFPLQGDR